MSRGTPARRITSERKRLNSWLPTPDARRTLRCPIRCKDHTNVATALLNIHKPEIAKFVERYCNDILPCTTLEVSPAGAEQTP